MGRAPSADVVVQIVTDPDRADSKIGVIADQVLTVSAADAGKIVTVQADGTLAVESPRQAAAVADLTDNTGGTADGTVVALAAVGAPALLSGAAAQDDVNARLSTLNDNLADLAAKVNALLAAMRTADLLAE